MTTIAFINEEACIRARMRALGSTMNETYSMADRFGWKKMPASVRARLPHYDALTLEARLRFEGSAHIERYLGPRASASSVRPSTYVAESIKSDYPRIAAHEAGHALSIIVLGGKVISATVHRHGGGVTRHEPEGLSAHSRVIAIAAGVAAEAEMGFGVREMQDHTPDSDKHLHDEQADWLVAWGQADPDIKKRAEDRAISICSANRIALACVQQLLLDNVGDDVPGERIERVIRTAWASGRQ